METDWDRIIEEQVQLMHSLQVEVIEITDRGVLTLDQAQAQLRKVESAAAEFSRLSKMMPSGEDATGTSLTDQEYRDIRDACGILYHHLSWVYGELLEIAWYNLELVFGVVPTMQTTLSASH